MVLQNLCPYYLRRLQYNGNAFAQERAVWDKGTANNWYANIGWLRGANYTKSSAINQLEMRQKKTFDPTSIDKELG